MQDRHPGGQPRHLDAMRDELLGKRREESLGFGDAPGVGEQPVHQRIIEVESAGHAKA